MSHRLLGRMLLATACIAGGFLACSSFDEDVADAPVDGGPQPTVEAGADAPSDEDASVDGGPALSAFCKTSDASFCWSFDTPPFTYDPSPSRLIPLFDGGAADLTDAAVSPPYALRLTTTGKIGAIAGPFIYLPDGGRTVRCDAEVSIRKPNTIGIVLMALSMQRSIPYVAAKQAQATDAFVKLYIADGLAPGSGSSDFGDVALGEWFHLTLEYVGSAVVATAKVGDDTMRGERDVGDAGTTHSAQWRADSSGASEVLYDNITCTY